MKIQYTLNDGEIQEMLLRGKKDIIGEEKLRGIKVCDCGEPLVKLIRNVPGSVFDIRESRQRFLGEALYARESVMEILIMVAEDVYPNRLKFFDAFRPIELQQKWFDDVYMEIKRKNPSWTDEEVRRETFIYVFPPSRDPKTPPPHSTGAAIDLTILDEEGKEFDMGSDYGEFRTSLVYTNASGLAEGQRDNRVLLVTSMAKRGFMSYPGEWWHFSMGDREWASYLGKSIAIYGGAQDPYGEISDK